MNPVQQPSADCVDKARFSIDLYLSFPMVIWEKKIYNDDSLWDNHTAPAQLSEGYHSVSVQCSEIAQILGSHPAAIPRRPHLDLSAAVQGLNMLQIFSISGRSSFFVC